MNITELDELEIKYGVAMDAVMKKIREKEAQKVSIIDVTDLLNYNDLIIDIRYLITKAEYLARELYTSYDAVYTIEYAKAMVGCEGEKKQSTYAKEHAKVETQNYLTKSKIWEVRYKYLRDQDEIMKDELYNKKTRIKVLCADGGEV